MIHIPGKETKKHISEALKIVFPGVKFSFRSSFDSVEVYWTDGPLPDEVERVLNRFESYTWVLDKTDYKRATGYEWKGQVYLGPEFLLASRTLSEDRRNILFLESKESWGQLKVFERYEIERDLIRQGILDGVSPRHCPDLMADKPVIDNRKKVENQVIPFPERRSEQREEVIEVNPIDEEIKQVSEEIEELRSELIRVASGIELIHKDVVSMSQSLDKLIVRFMQLKEKKSKKPTTDQ
ncbi:LPD29 domain-containing protein [Paenibacillus campinasensis]|uniref:Large polyvalent protein associated domain-containing protein n=1 Tax=Paenibacillus campinasensis TaxID=66347 RepID=A0A268EIF1_9BACL|nr:LPD29 domain-containing protein [Paenibacillus campinasensis]PAD72854.1 hypothetical protein CHH67_21340 [Paenibacillus campinasensis]